MSKTTAEKHSESYRASLQEGKSLPVRVSPESIVRFVGCIILLLLIFQVLVVLSEAFDYHNELTEYIKHFFNFHSENNFPAYFSSLLLAFAGLLSILVGYQEQSISMIRWAKWRMLGFLFFFLAVDEAIQIHEVISQGLRNNLREQLPGFLYYVWVVPYFFLVVLAVLYFFKFVMGLPQKIKKLIFLSGTVYVGAALGFEVIESYVFKSMGSDNLIYMGLVTIEELFEMIGVSIFIYALATHLVSLKGGLAFVDRKTSK